MRILILGGTSEAFDLATALETRHHKVTTALAGATSDPRKPAGRLLAGGLGGVEGLAALLSGHKFDFLIDATHPFAEKISANAVEAAHKTGIALLRVQRPCWTEPEGGNWWHVKTADNAAERLPSGSTVLLTIGRGMLEPFLARTDCRFVVRAIEAPESRLPRNFDLVLARPPFTLHDELTLMKRRGITHLVAKNSGGAQTSAKLEAAYLLKVQVIMIDRPVLAAAETVISVDAALHYLDQFPAPARRAFFFPLLRRT